MDSAPIPASLNEAFTTALLLDVPTLKRNLARMAAAVRRNNVAFRPHMKTAKCIEVARMATEGQAGGITVSTMAEAEYFFAHGYKDILYTVAIVPSKLSRVEALRAKGCDLKIVTDNAEVAAAIAAHGAKFRVLIELDSGSARAGIDAADPTLLAVAKALGPHLAGIMTHGGHSYGARDSDSAANVAEQERKAATQAADILRAAGCVVEIVSIGSSPGALNARGLAGVTEVRAGVYMFQDLMQATIGACELSDLACTVLASVVKVKSDDTVLIDAGALALSADKGFGDTGLGRLMLLDGTPTDGIVQRVWQEHGLVSPVSGLKVGDKVRILPVHVCHTAAGHNRYLLTEGGASITGAWDRMGGW